MFANTNIMRYILKMERCAYIYYVIHVKAGKMVRVKHNYVIQICKYQITYACMQHLYIVYISLNINILAFRKFRYPGKIFPTRLGSDRTFSGTVCHGNSGKPFCNFGKSRNFLKKPAAQPRVPSIREVLYVSVGRIPRHFPKLSRWRRLRPCPRKSGVSVFLKTHLCAILTVHYVNFEEIWSRFPEIRKFRKKKTVGKKKNREISGKIFPGFVRKFRKSCAFSVFFTETSAQREYT
jgi:hypothetical protein